MEQVIYNISMVWTAIFPYLPVSAYFMLCALTPGRQLQEIPDRKHSALNSRMSANLTLVGLSFAVISLLVTLFQDDLAKVDDALFLFTLSLAFFFTSYILLYLRLRRVFDTLSNGFTNNGLWALIAGLRALFLAFEPLRSTATVFGALLILCATYIVIDLGFLWMNRNKSE